MSVMNISCELLLIKEHYMFEIFLRCFFRFCLIEMFSLETQVETENNSAIMATSNKFCQGIHNNLKNAVPLKLLLFSITRPS